MTHATYTNPTAAGEHEWVKRVSAAVTVIVPVTERPDDLIQLYHEFAAPLRASGRPYAFLFVVEPWNRSVTEPLRDLVLRGDPVLGLREIIVHLRPRRSRHYRLARPLDDSKE